MREIAGKYRHLIDGEPRFTRGKGCPRCAGTGYSGRIAIFELFDYTEDLKEVFLKKMSLDSLKAALHEKESFRLLREDACSRWPRADHDRRGAPGVLTEFAYSCLDSSVEAARALSLQRTGQRRWPSCVRGGLTVLDLAEARKKQKKKLLLRKSFNDQDLYNMARELSTLQRSGIRIDKAFTLLIQSTIKQELKDLLSRILTDIKAGKGVAQAFEDTGRFSPFTISMINVGEAVGDLHGAFDNVAQYLRFQLQFKAELRNALTYPAFLLLASIVTVFFIFNFIVPRFFSIFGANPTTLPLPAKILFALSGWFTFKALGVLAGLIVIIVIAKKTIPPPRSDCRTSFLPCFPFPLWERSSSNWSCRGFRIRCIPCCGAASSSSRP